MHSGRRWPPHQHRLEPPPVEVVVRFERTTDPIAGCTIDPSGERQFLGWLGLVMALEQTLRAGAPPSGRG